MLATERTGETFTGLPEKSTLGRVLAAFKAAAPALGYGPRVIHAIDWLFSFTQPQDWTAGQKPIVWPSAGLQQEALSLGVTQAKALNRYLVEIGLVTMRDSPNGKRYGKRDAQGRIVEAYGFDLSPPRRPAGRIPGRRRACPRRARVSPAPSPPRHDRP